MRAVGLLLGLVMGLLSLEAVAAQTGIPVSYVKEMRPLPLSGYGTLVEVYSAPCQIDPRFLARWPEVYPMVLSHLDRDKVVGMSGWNTEEMEAHYVFSPDLQAAPVPFACNEQVQVLEVVVETLPIHAPLVTRWLKAYLVLDLELQSALVEIIYTIRGERQE
jgi:hypothetical protein